MDPLAIPAGLLIGISLGALGGGGSILTVPALVYLLGQGPHAATTGSLLIVGLTALAGSVAHWRAGRVRLGSGSVFGLLGVAGSYLGTRASAAVDPDVLLVAFAGLMLVAAAAMLARQRRPRSVGGPVEEGPELLVATGSAAVATLAPARLPVRHRAGGRRSVGRPTKIVLTATVVGLLTGFFGVGGGFVVVPALVLALDFDMPTAVGTSLLVIAINSVAALGARVGESVHLNWPVLAVFTVTAMLGSLAGNRIADRVDGRRLTLAFVVLLVALAGYVAARSLPHLV